MKLTGQLNTYSFNPEKDAIQLTGKFNMAFKGLNQHQQPVLIKLLHPDLSRNLDSIQQFKNEFELRIDHPNIISAIEYIVHANQHHIIRPWVDGKDLSKKLRGHSVIKVIAIVKSVLQALDALHQQQVLHLDVQPKNIILGTNQQVYLTDLGLAQKISTYYHRKPFNIYYSAPEQILNHTKLYNPSTDLYAVGMLFFELLLGRKPLNDKHPEILMNLILAAPLINEEVNDLLFDVVKKATSKPRFNLPPSRLSNQELNDELMASQQHRYQSATEFIAALDNLTEEAFKTKSWWKFW